MSDKKTDKGDFGAEGTIRVSRRLQTLLEPLQTGILSQLANGGLDAACRTWSLLLLILFVRALPHITDPALREEAKAWMGQEAQHFKQHRRFNEVR